MKKYFSLRKYKKNMIDQKDTPNSWADKCDGLEVIDGFCLGYPICDEWTIERK